MMRKIPAEFWQSLDVDDFTAMMDRGYLNHAECARLWKIAGWTDPIPERMDPLVRRRGFQGRQLRGRNGGGRLAPTPEVARWLRHGRKPAIYLSMRQAMIRPATAILAALVVIGSLAEGQAIFTSGRWWEMIR